MTDYLDRRRVPIPTRLFEPFWRAVSRLVAWLPRPGQDRPGTAVATRIAAITAFNRGVLMAEEGMVFAAVAAFEQAIEAGDEELASKSAFNIAMLSAKSGDVTWAVVNYSRAIQSGHQDVRAKAAFNLAGVLEAGGDVSGAQAALRLAIETRNDQVIPYAVDRLRFLGANESGIS